MLFSVYRTFPFFSSKLLFAISAILFFSFYTLQIIHITSLQIIRIFFTQKNWIKFQSEFLSCFSMKIFVSVFPLQCIDFLSVAILHLLFDRVKMDSGYFLFFLEWTVKIYVSLCIQNSIAVARICLFYIHIFLNFAFYIYLLIFYFRNAACNFHLIYRRSFKRVLFTRFLLSIAHK